MSTYLLRLLFLFAINKSQTPHLDRQWYRKKERQRILMSFKKVNSCEFYINKCHVIEDPKYR